MLPQPRNMAGTRKDSFTAEDKLLQKTSAGWIRPHHDALPMNHLYHDPRDSSAFAEKREYVKIDQKFIKRFWSKTIEVESGCAEWQGGLFSTGYGCFSWIKTVLAHRMSFGISRGYFPTGLHVCHKCDNKRCVRPDHLFSGTARDNLLDLNQKGRASKVRKMPPESICRGANHGRSKLRDNDIREIRRLCAEGRGYKEVGAIFGVTDSNVSYIARRITWGHVPDVSLNVDDY